jgi:hypothetical protein
MIVSPRIEVNAYGMIVSHETIGRRMNMSTNEIIRILLMLSPVFLIQLALGIYALLDLARRRVVRGPRALWVVALVFGLAAIPTGIILSGIYLAWGRNAEAQDDTD